LLSIIAFAVMRKHLAVDPKIGVALLVLQAVVILGWNTYDARYFGGVHYALMILFAMFLSESIRNRIVGARWFPAAVVLLIVPWMALQLVYGAQFMKLIFHLESKQQFLERYVPLYRDFVWLDRALPRDAVLLSIPYGLASIYAPRPLYYHVLDVPPRRPAFLVSYDPAGVIDVHGRFTAGEEIYEDRAAVIATFRIPGRKPQLGTLHVRRLN